jgi:hypothetical protein
MGRRPAPRNNEPSMRPPADVTTKQLLRYVKLEEDEDTAVLLKATSFLYVGAAMVEGGTRHYWSYPTADGVAWVSSSDESLQTESGVPPAIQAATLSRGKHPANKLPKPRPAPDRTPVPEPVWIPHDRAPATRNFPVWEACIPLGHAARVFGATPTKVDVGYAESAFCVKLTCGRYAWLSAPARNPMPVEISLELHTDSRSREQDDIGFVFVSDLLEILGALGIEYVPPTVRYQYEWR